MTRVAHAVTADLDAVTDVLGRAFADDPVQQWLFAPADDPHVAIRSFLGFFTLRYFALGHVYVADAVAGATLWAPPDRHALGEPDISTLLDLVRPHHGADTEAVLGELGRAITYLPHEPHFYLGIAGVDPQRQGAGIGAALMTPGLDAADAGGFAVHLESSNPANVSFYRRHGFEILDEFRLGGDGPVMIPMRREPR